MKHLRTQAVEHGEANVGAVFGRIVVDPEWTFTEGHVHDLGDLVGHAAGLGVVRDDRGERLQHLFTEALVRASLIFGGPGGVRRDAAVGKVVGPLGEGPGGP